MIRISAYTHDSEKAIRLFNDLESKGFIENALPYNSMIYAMASTKRYAPQAIEYWHKMGLKNVVPDRHTHVAVLKACA
jgi:pentatricopeptide repeat protein